MSAQMALWKAKGSSGHTQDMQEYICTCRGTICVAQMHKQLHKQTHVWQQMSLHTSVFLLTFFVSISLCKQHSRHDNNILQALQQQYVHMEQMVVMVTFAQANVTSAQALTTKQLPSHREVSLTNQLLTCLDVGPQENQRFHRAPIGHAATQV